MGKVDRPRIESEQSDTVLQLKNLRLTKHNLIRELLANLSTFSHQCRKGRVLFLAPWTASISALCPEGRHNLCLPKWFSMQKSQKRQPGKKAFNSFAQRYAKTQKNYEDLSHSKHKLFHIFFMLLFNQVIHFNYFTKGPKRHREMSEVPQKGKIAVRLSH